MENIGYNRNFQKFVSAAQKFYQCTAQVDTSIKNNEIKTKFLTAFFFKYYLCKLTNIIMYFYSLDLTVSEDNSVYFYVIFNLSSKYTCNDIEQPYTCQLNISTYLSYIHIRPVTFRLDYLHVLTPLS